MIAYNPKQPWETVLREAAANVEFWQRELQELALIFLQTRGFDAPSWATQQPEQPPAKRNNTWIDNDAQDIKKEICINWNKGKCSYSSCPR